MKNGHRRTHAYGEREQGRKYVLDDYTWSRNSIRGLTIRRWKRLLKKKARSKNRMNLIKEMELL